MKLITIIMADLDRAPLGQRSRLGMDLCGRTVLRRSIERVMQAKRASSVHVVVPATQRQAVADLVCGLNVAIETHNAGPAPYAGLVQAGRGWGLDGWRGGS